MCSFQAIFRLHLAGMSGHHKLEVENIPLLGRANRILRLPSLNLTPDQALDISTNTTSPAAAHLKTLPLPIDGDPNETYDDDWDEAGAVDPCLTKAEVVPAAKAWLMKTRFQTVIDIRNIHIGL